MEDDEYESESTFLHSLPTEILHKIFSEACPDAVALFRLRQVCRHFRSLWNPILFKETKFLEPTGAKCVVALCRFGVNFCSSLDLSGITSVWKEATSYAVINRSFPDSHLLCEALSFVSPSLEKLRLPPVEIDHKLPSLPNLTVLNTNGAYLPLHALADFILLSPKLEVLLIRTSRWGTFYFHYEYRDDLKIPESKISSTKLKVIEVYDLNRYTLEELDEIGQLTAMSPDLHTFVSYGWKHDYKCSVLVDMLQERNKSTKSDFDWINQDISNYTDIEQIIDRLPEHIERPVFEIRTRLGLTLLHCAVLSGNQELIDVLVRSKYCDKGIVIETAPGNHTQLHAWRTSFPNGMSLDHEPEVPQGYTSMHIHLVHGRGQYKRELTKHLVSLGFDINACGPCGRTPLLSLLQVRSAEYEWSDEQRTRHHNSAAQVTILDKVEAAIDCGADLTVRDSIGRTVLHYAAISSLGEVASKFIDCCPSLLDVQDEEGNTALMLALRGRRFLMASELVTAGARADVMDRKHNTIWHILSTAMNYSSYSKPTKDICQQILATQPGGQVRALVHHRNLNLHTPLELALISQGETGYAEWLVKEAKADVNQMASDGRTPLWISCSRINEQMRSSLANFLLKSGADVRVIGRDGKPLLYLLAEKKVFTDDLMLSLLQDNMDFLESCKYPFCWKEFLKAPAYQPKKEEQQDDPEAGGPAVSTALIEKIRSVAVNHDASELISSMIYPSSGQVLIKQVAQLLKIPGIDISATDIWGRNALHMISLEPKVSDAQVVKKLLKRSPSMANKPDDEGNIPLFVALLRERTAIVPLLVKHSKPNTVDAYECNALHLALKSWWPSSVIRMLLEHGVRADVPDSKGQTAIHYAAKQGSLYIDVMEELLLSCKKFTNEPDHKGHTADEYAIPPLATLIQATAAAKSKKPLAGKRHSQEVLKSEEDRVSPPLRKRAREEKPESRRSRRGAAEKENKASAVMNALASGKFALATQRIRQLKEKGRSIITAVNDGRTIWHVIADAPFNDEAPSFLEAVQSIFASDPHTNGTSVDAYDNNHDTALHIAVRKGNLALVRWLVDNAKPNLHLQDENGRTPLWIAAEIAYEAMEGSIAKTTPPLNRADKWTIVSHIVKDDPATVLSVRDEDGKMLLVFMAERGVLNDENLVNLFQMHQMRLAGTKTSVDWSLVQRRETLISLDLLSTLMSMDSSVKASDVLLLSVHVMRDYYRTHSRGRCSALELVSRKVVGLFSKKKKRRKTDVDSSLCVKDEWGNNFLHLCALRGGDSRRCRIVSKILKKAPTLARQCNHDGDTPLFIALALHQPGLAAAMMNYMDITQVDPYQRNALHLAIKYNHDEWIIRRFLAQGIKADEPDAFGRTAIHYAAMQQEKYAFLFGELLKSCKNFDNDVDSYGKRADEYAVPRIQEAIREYLAESRKVKSESSAARQSTKQHSNSADEGSLSARYSLRKRSRVSYAEDDDGLDRRCRQRLY